MNIEELRKSDRIILESVAGSCLYGLNTPSSDMDVRGIFMDSLENVFDITGEKDQEISDDRQDVKFYSLRKFLKLAIGCNPNIIELLWLPDSAIIWKSPVYDELVSHRDWFMSKQARHTFMGYAYAQIQRAKGLGKKGNSIPKYVNEEGIGLLRQYLCQFHSEQEKDSIERVFGGDFLKYLMKERTSPSKSMSFSETLDHPSVKSMLPPKIENYIQKLENDIHGFPFRPCPFTGNPDRYDVSSVEGSVNLYRLYRNGTGFLDRNGLQVVCRSISMEREKSDFEEVIRVNLEQYRKDKAEYDSFWEWMANRNESRYTSDWNGDTMTDNKNLMHTMRLLLCAKSIAETGIPKVRFEGEERNYLMGIRQGKYSYGEIMGRASSLMEEVNGLFDKSLLPRSADVKKINRWYMEIMKQED